MGAALVIGGGPAGLMAAEALLEAGVAVTLTEAKPTLGRKFLMAGKSGLNLAKMEPLAAQLAAFRCPPLDPIIADFPAEAVRDWAEALGQTVFAGSTGRLFPTAMKASPLLRAWLARLEAAGLTRRSRWRWQGFDGSGHGFDTPDGPRVLTPAVTVFALGGASWARLGSDGHWARVFAEAGIALGPFAPSNAGIAVRWSDPMRRHFGAPLKGLAFTAGDITSRGEATLSARGLEGGGVYSLTPALRDGAGLRIDIAPDQTAEQLARRLARPRGKQSLGNHLRKALRLTPAVQALVMECARPLPDQPAALAARLKALTLPHDGLRPLDEAISTAGGVFWEALDDGLMLKDRPGCFVAGEMIDWEAPTGGYLITGCLATGRWAGRHAARYCQA